ncbi:hypothetical protein [Leptospira neocaledonica]|uniref:Uncharacterized protein n=1 Tax=Leptospira neocaledonica TaxID=2023192 RepID=A0A2M9ZWB4_9LEPT|nr:hypothetical protein [Leptospira neocaledonica]PJZ76309.1 hypothetical protein CH365_13015 [Leptospira neocaledonica]
MIYFFAKVDNSNKLLEFAETLGGFYIGFYDEKNKISNEIVEFNSDIDFEIKLNYPDWEYLNLFSEERWREKVRIITYDSHKLSFWEITNKIGRFHEYHTLNTLPEKFKKIKQDDLDNFNLWNFLPVVLKNSINRSLLPSSIDSLSVYQYLNRGTFRPIFRLSKYKDKLIFSNDIENDRFEFTVKNHHKKDIKLIETKYSRILRFYFDAIVKKGKDFKQDLKRIFSNFSLQEKNQILSALFSPAQVETMAMLLIQDIGFTADIGIGKGLDFVDIKGSLRHREEIIIEKNLSKLTKYSLVKLNQLTLNKIISEKTINIQCKAKPHSDLLSDLLYILPDSKKSSMENVIFIDKIISCMGNDTFSKDFPLLADWLELQKYTLGLN